jgi:uncharacterized protein
MDVGIVAVSFVFTYFVARWFDLAASGSYAIFCALAVATWRLRSFGSGWRDLGLRRPKSAIRVVAWVIALYVASALMKLLIVDRIADAAGWPSLNLSRFSHLPGNATVLMGTLVLVWLSAAFGEEMVFRGFLLNRLERSFGSGSVATVAAVISQALLFGLAHWYLGWRGVTTAGLIGLLYGVVYVGNGRNLVPLILAHGLTDSLSLIAIYAGMVAVT